MDRISFSWAIRHLSKITFMTETCFCHGSKVRIKKQNELLYPTLQDRNTSEYKLSLFGPVHVHFIFKYFLNRSTQRSTSKLDLLTCMVINPLSDNTTQQNLYDTHGFLHFQILTESENAKSVLHVPIQTKSLFA